MLFFAFLYLIQIMESSTNVVYGDSDGLAEQTLEY